MTTMSSECDISDHKGTWFEFRQDIFFSDADGYPSWLSEICYGTSEESTIFDSIEYWEDLFSECFAVFSEKMRDTCYTIDTWVRRRTKSEIVCGLWECRDEVIESIVMKFESALLCNNRCTYISLWCDFDEIVDVHTDTSCCREASCRIVWLIDEAHLFELFHVVANGCRGDIHTLITDERFTSCCIPTYYILSDDQSENLDFSCVNGGLPIQFFVDKK